MNKEIIKEDIILPARRIIRDDLKIKLLYTIPSIFSVIFMTGVLAYQSIYTYVVIFGNKEKALNSILKFIESGVGIKTIIALIIFLILYFLISPIFEGGLIKYIHLKNKSKDPKVSQVVGYGVFRFLPIFEYENIFAEIKLISILNFYLFLIRFLGVEYIKQLNIFLLIASIISIILNIAFIYTKNFIVIENKGVFKSIGDSSKISFLNLKTTIKLYILIFVLNLRVVLNFIIFLLFPILMAVAIGIVTSKFLLFLAIAILSIIFIIVILALSYINSVLDIFKTSLWYYAYSIYLKDIQEEDKLTE